MLAANIKAEMARRSMSQQDLAHALGMSQAAVSKKLKGSTQLRVDELHRIADILGVSAESLLKDAA